MDRIHHPSAIAMPPPSDTHGTAGYPTEGDPVGGIAATVLTAWSFHSVVEEIRNVVVDAGLTPDKDVLTQLRQSIRRQAASVVTAALDADTVFTADHAGLVGVAITANRTFTLPLANAAGGRPIRFTFARTDATAFTATIARAGSDTIEGATSATIARGERVTLISDGVSTWRWGPGRFTQSLAAPGWQRLPSGLIIQWGNQQSANLATTGVTWPIAFPTACLWAGGTGFQASGAVQAYVTLNACNTTGAAYNCFYAAAGLAPQLASSAQVDLYYLGIGI